MNATPVAQIGLGPVRHRRLRPVDNAFAYDTYFLMLPPASFSAVRTA